MLTDNIYTMFSEDFFQSLSNTGKEENTDTKILHMTPEVDLLRCIKLTFYKERQISL